MKFAKNLLAFALALFGASNAGRVNIDVRKVFGSDRFVKLSKEAMSQDVISLLQVFDADHFEDEAEGFSFRLTEEAHRVLEQRNVPFEDRTEALLKEMEENFADENFVCTGDDCHKRSLQDFYGAYQELSAIQQRARSIVSGVSFARIGSLGQSYEGNDMMTVEIGDGSKPLVFYFCNIHAREWLPAMYCIYMAEMLIQDGGHPLLDTFDFTILLTANPDGYIYTHESDPLWRKTRRPVTSRCIGTDPNRNYDSYHCGAGTSNNPCDNTYCGSEPWTENEVRNIRDFGLANQDRLIAMNDVHAKGNMWMHPYGAIRTRPSDYDEMYSCARDASDGIFEQSNQRFAYGTVIDVIYPAAGVSVDWFYDTVGVKYAYTAELRGPGNSWQPPTVHIMRSNREVFAGMEASLNCVARQEGLGSPAPPPVPSPGPAPTPNPTPAPVPVCTGWFC